MDKISIIVPVYNVEKYISKCCNSVLCQNYKNFELILINDGSTDNSAKICDDIALKDKRVIVRNTHNQGVSAARNLGLEIAQGSYIMFIDADDWMEDDALDRIIQERKNDVDLMVFGSYREYGTTSKKTQVVPFYGATKSILKMMGEIPDPDSVLCSVWNKVYKSEIVKTRGIKFDNDVCFGEDLLFNLKYLAYSNTVQCAPIYTYHYNCTNMESAMHRFFPGYKDYIERISTRLSKLLQQCGIDDERSLIFWSNFICDRYSYAMESCLEQSLPMWEKCLFLRALLNDIEPDLFMRYNKSNLTLCKLVFYRNSKILFYIATIIIILYRNLNSIALTFKRWIKKAF